MFYYYFRFFNWICSIFGLRKPFNLSISEIKSSAIFWNKLWSLCVVITVIATQFLLVDLTIDYHIVDNLEEISDINNTLISMIIIVIHVTNGDKLYVKIYDNLNGMLSAIKLSDTSIRMMSIKFYAWFIINALVFLTSVTVEFIYDNFPYSMVIRVPLFLSMSHLIIHLCLILCILKVINFNMMEVLKLKSIEPPKIFLIETQQRNSFLYLMDINFYFIYAIPNRMPFDLKFMCKIYDGLCTCIFLLQKCHGLQVLLSIWLMFTSAVTAVTLISLKKTEHAWLDIMKGTQVFIWFGIGCYVDNQIRQEVEKTDALIIKYLIDFRCDNITKNTLQTFKQAINTNRLQFKACNLYRLNFATVLGTVVSIITYSVISIQLF